MAEERPLVEQVVGETFDSIYRALQGQHGGAVQADAFFAGAVLANMLLDDPLLHDATRAVLLTSADDNPRGDAIVQDVHRRIRARSQPETPETPDAPQ